MIEIVIVVVILALLATMAAPRLTSTTGRKFDLAADAVADLLLMFAQRDRLARQPVGIMLDTRRGTLMLMLLDEGADGTSIGGDWRPDPFVQPVKFPNVVDIESITVAADYEIVDVRDWPLSHRPGEPRPSIRISMTSRDGEFDATIDLKSHAIAPVRSERGGRGRRGGPSPSAQRVPVDLDAAGRSREDW